MCKKNLLKIAIIILIIFMILPIIYLFLGFFIKELFFDNFVIGFVILETFIYCHTFLLWAKLRYNYKDGKYINSNEVSLL